jgi:hypothetical protein
VRAVKAGIRGHPADLGGMPPWAARVDGATVVCMGEDGGERLRGTGAAVSGSLLTAAIWVPIGPWDLSTIGPDGRYLPHSEGIGAVRLFAVLVVVDVLVVIGWWRGWITVVGPAAGAGACWAVLGFLVIASARVSGANIGAGLWLGFGPAVAAANALAAFTLEMIAQDLRRRRRP